MTSPMTAKTCEAWFLLEAADLRGLPAPFDVAVTDYAPVKLGLRSVEDLNAWATALDADATSREVDGRIHWNLVGELHDMPVALFVVTLAEQVTA